MSFLLLLSLGCRETGETKFVTDRDEDGVSEDDDCNDEDASIGLPGTYYMDYDHDGYGEDSTAESYCERPAGYSEVGGDCDDLVAEVYPGAEDICDGLDNDCDGTIDNGATATMYYVDADQDGYGDDASTVYDCTQPEGTATVGGDCNDADAAYNPGASESDCADPNDYNCDGSVGYADDDGDGYAACEECDDGSAAANPAAEETCNDQDDDCDGLVDDADDTVSGALTWYRDLDGDSYGDATTSTAACSQPEGYGTDNTDCDDTRADVNPAASEVCNDLDDDCDSLLDDADDSLDTSTASTWYVDADSDGYGSDSSTLLACDQPGGTSLLAGDCDDADAAYNPGALEEDCTDPSDYNCDGAVGYADADGDGYAACEECDDGNAANNPAATETCDGADNDCDGTVDEDDASDALTWYADADGDGHGDDTSTTEACSAPSGYLADNTDCDDTNADVSPAEVDLCNGIDDDCDGTADEDDASDALTWYADADADGFGNAGSSVKACARPGGYVSDSDDCDDTSADVSPGEIEVCNNIDDDCDGTVDEDDAADASTWYADSDGDGYGNAASTTVACDAPVGYLADDSDCDDTSADVSPTETERCNGIDDDCDSSVDEGVDTTYYRDADGDSYGNAAVTDNACSTPSGYVSDDTDCDDSDATSYPGATESYDGADNDCDGTVDNTGWSGTGADGSLSVSTSTTVNESWAVTGISGVVVTVLGSPGLAEGDEVLVINLHGSDSEHANVGNYEFAWVSSVSGHEITLTASLSATFGQRTNADLTDQAVQVVRVPQYTDVTVSSGGSITAEAWDGETGGVLAFRATGVVTVASGGNLNADEMGYWAGETGTAYNNDAFQGESYAGEGDGNLPPSGGYYGNWAAGYYQNNYGGGGAMITGGGGNYGGGATAGDSWTGGSYPAAEAGDTYGDAALADLFLGSGGAGVWYGRAYPGPGGDGAGIVFVAANEIVASDSAAISAIGGTTARWAHGTWTYGAGGGAGGSIWLLADTLTLGSASVDATGGFGEDTHIRVGGDGGYGRVRLDYNTLNGYGYGSGGDTTEQAIASEPDAGHAETP
ncbi:MAG: putative metal-binding motif-containing protein [Deltaproteobacteria bacterium]|nr:putative metal-binding motif-containing protein [Deltaproteobacteria bacterium]